MPRFTQLLQEALSLKSSDDVITSIQNGDMVKSLNGKKNLPAWLKDAVTNNDENTLNQVKRIFDSLIKQISDFARGNANVTANESIFLLIKKSTSLEQMKQIVSENRDALINLAMASNKGWFKNSQSVRKVNDNPYSKDLWHEMEKDLQDKLANSRQRLSANKKENVATETDSYKVLYQDDSWVLAQPKTFEGDSWLASNMIEFECKNRYGKDSHTTKSQWCTAADEGYYEHYSVDGNGYYVIKTPGLFDAAESWQIAFNGVNHVEFMDKYDGRNFYDGFISKAPDALLAKIVLDNPKHKYCGNVSLLDLKRAGFELKENTLDTDINGNKELDDYVLDKVLRGINPKVASYLKGNDILKVTAFINDIPSEYQEYFITQIGIDNILTYVDTSDGYFEYEDERPASFYELNIIKELIPYFVESKLPIQEKIRVLKQKWFYSSNDAYKMLLTTEQGNLLIHLLLSTLPSKVERLSVKNLKNLLEYSKEDLKSVFGGEYQSLTNVEKQKLSISMFVNTVGETGVDLDLLKTAIHILTIINAYLPGVWPAQETSVKNLIHFYASVQAKDYKRDYSDLAMTKFENVLKQLPKFKNYNTFYIQSEYFGKVIKLFNADNKIQHPEKAPLIDAMLSIPKDESIDYEIAQCLADDTYAQEYSNIPATVLAQVFINKGDIYSVMNIDSVAYRIDDNCKSCDVLRNDTEMLCNLFKLREPREVDNLVEFAILSGKYPLPIAKRIISCAPSRTGALTDEILYNYFDDVDKGLIDLDNVTLDMYLINGRNKSYYYNKARKEFDIKPRDLQIDELSKSRYEQYKRHYADPKKEPTDIQIKLNSLEGYASVANLKDHGYDKCVEFMKLCKSNGIPKNDLIASGLDMDNWVTGGTDEFLACEKEAILKNRITILCHRLSVSDRFSNPSDIQTLQANLKALQQYQYLSPLAKELKADVVVSILKNHNVKEVNAKVQELKTTLDSFDDDIDKCDYLSLSFMDSDVNKYKELSKIINVIGLDKDIYAAKSTNELMATVKLIENTFNAGNEYQMHPAQLSDLVNLYYKKNLLYKAIVNAYGIDDYNISRMSAFLEDASKLENTEEGASNLMYYENGNVNGMYGIDILTFKKIGKAFFIKAAKFIHAHEEARNIIGNTIKGYKNKISKSSESVTYLHDFIDWLSFNLNTVLDLYKNYSIYEITKPFMHYVADLKSGTIDNSLSYHKYANCLNDNSTDEDYKLNLNFYKSGLESPEVKDIFGRSLKSVYFDLKGNFTIDDVQKFNEYIRVNNPTIPVSLSMFKDFIQNRQKFISNFTNSTNLNLDYDFVDKINPDLLNKYKDYLNKGGKLSYGQYVDKIYLEESLFRHLYKLARM